MMDLVKVRKVGNSAVVTLPREIAERIPAGTRVVVQELENGDILVSKPETYEPVIREIGRKVVRQHRGLLDRLAAHEPSEVPQDVPSERRA